MRTRVQILRPGELVSVRVFPPAKGASSQDLAADLDRCIASVRHKESLREGRREPLDESMEGSIGDKGRNEVLPVSAPTYTGNSSESGER